MKKSLFALIFTALFSVVGYAQGTPPFVLTEGDGSPRVLSPTRITVTNGTLSCTGKSCTLGTGTNTPGGSTTQVQYNNAGAFGGISGLTTNGTNIVTLTSASATAFNVGPNGTTNPIFQIVGNVASAATGLSITGNAAGSGVTITALSSGTDENITILPKGAGLVALGVASSSTGKLRFAVSGDANLTTIQAGDSPNSDVVYKWPADDPAAGEVFKVTSFSGGTAVLEWAADGGMSIGGTVTSATAGSVLFAATGPVLAQDNSNLFWNDTDDRLGIGTSSPSTALHVRSASDTEVSVESTGTNGRRWTIQSSANSVPAIAGSFQIIDRTGPLAAVIISNTGLVGLNTGTSTPAARLDVNGTTYLRDDVTILSAGTGASQNIFLSDNQGGLNIVGAASLASAADGASVSILGNNFTSNNGYLYLSSGSHNSAKIIFRTAATSASLTERMEIDATGNVGINATSFGTSAANVVAIGAGTAPTSQPADMTQLWTSDVAGGDNRLRILSESGSRITLGNNSLVFATGTTDDTGLTRAAAAVLRISDASTNAGGLLVGPSTASGAAGSVTLATANVATQVYGQVSENITLNTGGATTDSTIDLPATSIILSVVARVTTTIAGVDSTTLSVGDPTTAARFGTGTTLTAGGTIVGISQFNGSVSTDATGPTQVSAAKVRLTLSGGGDNTPSAGAVRITINYISLTAPTS